MGSLLSSCNFCTQNSVSKNFTSSNQSRPTIKLLLIGLDNAGKTTTVMHLLGNPIDDVVPTVGFSSVDMRQFNNKFKVQIYDLGGGAKIRGIWKNYFALVHGVIYVIDAADAERVSEVKDCLTEVISHEKVAKKPFLILITKQDIEGALEDVQMMKELDIETLANKYESITKIESCWATANYDPSTKQRDEGIDQGYTWLVRQIMRDWDVLNDRVERESNEQIEIEKQIMQERFKRFRTKQEQQEELMPDARYHDVALNGNPFKPIKEVVNSVHYDDTASPSPKVAVADPRGATRSVHASSRSPEKYSPTRRTRSAATSSSSKSPTKRINHSNQKHHTTSSANGRAHKVLIESQDRSHATGAKRNNDGRNFETHDRVVDHTQSSPEKRTSPHFSDTR